MIDLGTPSRCALHESRFALDATIDAYMHACRHTQCSSDDCPRTKKNKKNALWHFGTKPLTPRRIRVRWSGSTLKHPALSAWRRTAPSSLAPSSSIWSGRPGMVPRWRVADSSLPREFRRPSTGGPSQVGPGRVRSGQRPSQDTRPEAGAVTCQHDRAARRRCYQCRCVRPGPPGLGPPAAGTHRHGDGPGARIKSPATESSASETSMALIEQQ